MTIEDAIAMIPKDDDGLPWRWRLSQPGYENGVYLDGKAKAEIHHPLSSGGGPRFIGIAETPADAMRQAAIKAREFAAMSARMRETP